MRPEYVWAVRVMDVRRVSRARDLEGAYQDMGEAVSEAERVRLEFPGHVAWIELVGGDTRRVQA